MFDTATWMIWKKFRWKCAALNVLKTSTLILLGFDVFPFLILLTRIVYLIFILSKGETSSIAGDSLSFRHFAIYTAVMSVLGIRESSKSHITLLPCCHSFLLSHCSSVLQLQPPAQAFYYEVCKPCSMDRGCFQRRRIVISYFAWLSRSLFCTFAGGPDMWPFFFLLIREPVPSGMPFFVAYILFLSKVKNSVHVTDFTCVLFVLIVWLQASMTQCCRMDYCERDRSDLDVQAFLVLQFQETQNLLQFILVIFILYLESCDSYCCSCDFMYICIVHISGIVITDRLSLHNKLFLD